MSKELSKEARAKQRKYMTLIDKVAYENEVGETPPQSADDVLEQMEKAIEYKKALDRMYQGRWELPIMERISRKKMTRSQYISKSDTLMIKFREYNTKGETDKQLRIISELQELMLAMILYGVK